MNSNLLLGALYDYTIKERVTLNWSVQNSFVWNGSESRLHLLDEESEALQNPKEISILIKERALKGYGSFVSYYIFDTKARLLGYFVS